jgi:hypothetical protein
MLNTSFGNVAVGEVDETDGVTSVKPSNSNTLPSPGLPSTESQLSRPLMPIQVSVTRDHYCLHPFQEVKLTELNVDEELVWEVCYTRANRYTCSYDVPTWKQVKRKILKNKNILYQV